MINKINIIKKEKKYIYYILLILLIIFVLIVYNSFNKNNKSNNVLEENNYGNEQKNEILKEDFSDEKNKDKKEEGEKEVEKIDYLKIGDFSGAIKHYLKLYKESSNDLDKLENGLLLIDSYFKYANYFYKEEEYGKKAIEILEEINTLLLDEEWIYYYYGYYYEITKKYNESINNYEKLLLPTEQYNKKNNPKNWDYFLA